MAEPHKRPTAPRLDQWPTGQAYDADLVAGAAVAILKACRREGLQTVAPLSLASVTVTADGSEQTVSSEVLYRSLRARGLAIPWGIFAAAIGAMLNVRQQSEQTGQVVARMGAVVSYNSRRRAFELMAPDSLNEAV